MPSPVCGGGVLLMRVWGWCASGEGVEDGVLLVMVLRMVCFC